MKLLVVLLFCFFVLSAETLEASTPFERWSRGIEEVIENVYNQYRNRIKIISEEHEIEKNFLWALVVVESNGNSSAVSSTGVRGLTMLTSDVVDLIKSKTGITIDPFHPYESLWGGAWYLKHLMENYNFSIEMAITAYHYGPTGLRRMLLKNNLENLYYYRKIEHTISIINRNY